MSQCVFVLYLVIIRYALVIVSVNGSLVEGALYCIRIRLLSHISAGCTLQKVIILVISSIGRLASSVRTCQRLGCVRMPLNQRGLGCIATTHREPCHDLILFHAAIVLRLLLSFFLSFYLGHLCNDS